MHGTKMKASALISSTVSRRPTKPADFDQRVKAVSHFRELEAAEALAAANKRVGNIQRSLIWIEEIDLALLQETQRRRLRKVLK